MDYINSITYNSYFRNPHSYKRLLDPGGQFCGGYEKQPEAAAANVLILVASAINHADRRFAIR